MDAACRLPKRPRKSQKPGDLDAVRLKLWRAIEYAEWGLLRSAASEDMNSMRSFIHCLSQASGQFSKVLEVSELQDRIEQLEQSRPLRRAV